MTSDPGGEGLEGLDELVLPALELAVIVAGAAAKAHASTPIPKGIRPFIKFKKLAPSARPAVRRVLDEDDDFRAKVAATAEQIDMPEASTLFLTRPEGWMEAVADLARQAGDEHAASATERSERALRRRLAGAETAVARSEQAAVAAHADVARVARELAVERRARRAAEARAEDAERALTEARESAEAARRAAAEERARARGLTEELRLALAELSTARRLQEEALERAEHAGESRDEGERETAALTLRVQEARRTIGAALDEASLAVDALSGRLEAIGRAAGLAAPDAGGGPTPVASPADASRPCDRPGASAGSRDRARPGDGAGPRDSAGLGGRAGPRDSGARPARRSAHPLPPAVFDDSAEAAEHLVRVPGMLVLVDGYNVTLATRARLPIAEQRGRLIDACAELAARSGADVHVVFDGAEGAGDLPARPGRRGVRWAFSAPDVEADDVLLGLVADLDAERPVTVASSDRRVLEGARKLGANGISTAQLLGTLRRERSVRPR